MAQSGGTLEVLVDIDAAEMLRLYRGQARDVVARAVDGRVVRFPLTALRAHVRDDGVHGRFLLRFDARQKLLGLDRL